MTEENVDVAAGSQDKQFNILRIYLKDVSFEAPNSPDVFVRDFKPQVSVEMTTTNKKLDEDVYEAVLKISVAAKEAGKTGFLIEIEQAGIFHIQGCDDERLNTILEASCPKNLFPFAREAVSDLVTKGGFPPLLLAPVNFHTIYRQRMAAQSEQSLTE